MARTFKRGSQLGKYRLERRIGQGAFASVWRARDQVEGRFVALKITDPAQVAVHGRHALEHEARVASQLEHPNIVSVRNADWIDGHFVLATDLAERSLADYAGARRSGAVALRVIRDVVAGLAYAHARRIVHRDVKPENILVFKDRRAALCDFGVAQIAQGPTKAYTEAGTLGYMAPEQAYGKPRFASDVFSLGLIAIELLAGDLPTWPFEWPPPGHRRFLQRVPAPLRPVLQKAAEFEPSRRYTDAVGFQQAFERALSKSEAPKRSPVRRRKTKPEPTPFELEAALFRRRHGRSLDLGADCHRCGGPISEAWETCPWCGAKDNSFRELTRYPLVCPECERGVRAEWTSCPWCYSGRLAGNGRPPRPDPRAERRCSRAGCNGQLRPFMRYCPVCKTKPKRRWSHPSLPERCGRCRWPVSGAFFRYCPWCGKPQSGSGHAARSAP